MFASVSLIRDTFTIEKTKGKKRLHHMETINLPCLPWCMKVPSVVQMSTIFISFSLSNVKYLFIRFIIYILDLNCYIDASHTYVIFLYSLVCDTCNDTQHHHQ